MRKRLACAALPALILVAMLAPVPGPAANGEQVSATAPPRPVAPLAAELGPRPFAEAGPDAPEPTGSWAAVAGIGAGSLPVAPARRANRDESAPALRSGRLLTPPSRAPPVLR
jgi:hypothetical protein